MERQRNLILMASGLILVMGLIAWGLIQNPELIEADAPKVSSDGSLDYSIVYLLTNDANVTNSPLSPANLQDKLGANVAHTWAEVLAHDKDAPIEALIIHDSALSLVDRTWLINAYQRGVVISGFNLDGPQMAELVNDVCIARDNFAAEPYSGSFYVIVSFSIAGDNPDDVALVKDTYQDTCGETPPSEGPAGYVSHSSGRSTYDLNNDEDFNIFTQTLVNHLR